MPELHGGNAFLFLRTIRAKGDSPHFSFGICDDACFGNCRVLRESRLDVNREDVKTTGDDHVSLAI